MGALTSTAGLDAPSLFDSQYYASLYPDLQAAYGSDSNALRTHWLAHGIAEHRRASPIFDCDLYLGLYGDLSAAFGTDCAAAMNHFKTVGLPREARRASVEFDVAYYLSAYPDLVRAFGGGGYLAAANHFMTIGLWNEGRRGSNELDVGNYICRYSDLFKYFGGNYRSAIEHWATLGLATEGRRGSASFDVHNYLSRYADLRAAFGTNYRAAMNHWLENGVREGRTGTPNDGGGSLVCPAGASVSLKATSTTAAQGFPSSWFGFPLPAGPHGLSGLAGTVSLVNSANVYSEVLFIVGYLPSGSCPSGLWPASTPQFGPAGMQPLASFIVKAPTKGTYSSPANFTLPQGLPLSGCILVGHNGGTVAAQHDVTAVSNLTLSYGGAPNPVPTALGVDGEFCFGQDWGCQRATTDNSQSFARVVSIAQPGRLRLLSGNISDSTFDGSSNFGAPPTGSWTARNEFYVYHRAECAALGATNGIAGPSPFLQHVPANTIHLLSVPVSGKGIGAVAVPVFEGFNTSLSAGDCLVQLFGMNTSTGKGGFDNETQVRALIQP